MLAMVDPRDEQRRWLKRVLQITGKAPTALAQEARLAPTTLTRFLNDPEHATALSARSISAVEKTTGLRYGEDPRPIGFRESEAEPFAGANGDAVFADLVKRTVGTANGIDPWTLRSRALEIAGYLPGDVLVVDLNRQPEPGDIVCAQVYDWVRAKAETIFRIWEPPFLVGLSLDAKYRKPLVVDNEHVVMRGVVMASMRPRTARHAPA
jgi:hypothetical protein